MPVDTVHAVMIGLCLFLIAMSKGGFPVGAVALPVLILVWPSRGGAARAAVAFMLPALCIMDIFAVVAYRRHVAWPQIRLLLPGAILGVAVGALLFVSDESALLALSDRALKLSIGWLGLVFCAYQAVRTRLLKHLPAGAAPGPALASGYGAVAGITSTLAHAAGPVMQMYLLPQDLPKKTFAGTNAAFFWILNLVKLLPFVALGRIEPANLALAAWYLPLLPLGVGAGWLCVHTIPRRYYIGFIYAVLGVTSVLLILKAGA